MSFSFPLAGGALGLEGVEVVLLDRFSGVEMLGLGGADFQPFCAPPPLGVAFLERELDRVGCLAALVDLRDLAGDAL